MRSVHLVVAIALLSIVPGKAYDGIVVFGDSLSDVGNTVSVFPDSDTARTITGYNGNPGLYAPGRFSNGNLWIDNLNSSLGFSPLLPNNGGNSSARNFAYAGATSSTGNTTTAGGYQLHNLLEQVDDYQTVLGPGLPLPGNTLFTIWSGGNDIIYSLPPYNIPVVTQVVANNISASINSLYASGGRSFLVPNLPFTGTAIDTVIADFNAKLEANLNAIRTAPATSDAQIFSLNVNSLLSYVVTHPLEYGLDNVVNPAYTETGTAPFGTVVGTPNTYYNWDGKHPTARIHQIIGASALSAIPEGSAFCYLAMALIGVVFSRRRH